MRAAPNRRLHFEGIRSMKRLVALFVTLVSSAGLAAQTPAGQTPAAQTPATQAPATQMPATKMPNDAVHMRAGAAKAADVGDVKVSKATGRDARTVAEIVAKGSELKDKTVLVHGQVVKYTPGVMGKNWVHLRDGTGSASDGTNDVLVTTQDETKIGDVVLARGTVRTDVNLGSGYAYKVLIEEAKLQK
jgi:hypothetical protein